MSRYGKKVIVKDGNVEKALKKLKKKVQESGLLVDLKNREQYDKPSVKRKISKSLAKRRWQKFVSDQSLPKNNY